MSDMVLGVGLAHKFETACNRNNVTLADVDRMCGGDMLAQFRQVTLGNAFIIDRQWFDHIKTFVEAMIPQLESTLNTIIRVDRSIRPVYPDWVKKVMHPELEGAGPSEYDLATVEQWLHDDQEKSVVVGNRIYDHLKKTDALKTCLGLRDGEEIKKKGIEVFRKFFEGKAVVLWASVVQDRDSDILVPYLVEEGGVVVVYWGVLDRDWDDSRLALRFAS